MICRQSPGVFEVRSLDGSRRFTVDWGAPLFLVALRLHPTRDLLAVVGSRDVEESEEHGVLAVRDRRTRLVELATGAITPLDIPDAHQLAWSPSGDRLAYVGPREMGVYELASDTRTTLGRHRSTDHAPEALSFSPDGRRIGYLRHRGGRYRMGWVDAATGEGRLIPKTCFRYDWWDDDHFVHDYGRGVNLLDLETGKTSLLASEARLPGLRSLLAERAPRWAEAMKGDLLAGGVELDQPRVFGDRLYLRARITAVPRADRAARFDRQAIVSVSRALTDPEIHYGPEPGSIWSFDLLNEGRAFGLHHVTTGPDGLYRHGWAFAGKDAHAIPDGFAPLPRLAGPKGVPEASPDLGEGSWNDAGGPEESGDFVAAAPDGIGAELEDRPRPHAARGTVEIRDVAEGLWVWRVEHPGWKPGQGWEPVVASTCVESGGETLVLDPLAPPADATDLWARLDERPPTVAVVLKPDHVRDVDAFVRRYGARAFGPDRFLRDDIPETELEPIHPGGELPGGLIALHDGRGRNETPLWLPEQRAIVFADGLTAPGGELRVWATPWHEERVLPALRAMLELPFERVIVSHGEPVHTRAAFERALERAPWRG
ncbi:MAG: hypothetical protein ACOC8B_00450 [Gemmatimonadota bacterium]